MNIIRSLFLPLLLLITAPTSATFFAYKTYTKGAQTVHLFYDVHLTQPDLETYTEQRARFLAFAKQLQHTFGEDKVLVIVEDLDNRLNPGETEEDPSRIQKLTLETLAVEQRTGMDHMTDLCKAYQIKCINLEFRISTRTDSDKERYLNNYRLEQYVIRDIIDHETTSHILVCLGATHHCNVGYMLVNDHHFTAGPLMINSNLQISDDSPAHYTHVATPTNQLYRSLDHFKHDICYLDPTTLPTIHKSHGFFAADRKKMIENPIDIRALYDPEYAATSPIKMVAYKGSDRSHDLNAAIDKIVTEITEETADAIFKDIVISASEEIRRARVKASEEKEAERIMREAREQRRTRIAQQEALLSYEGQTEQQVTPEEIAQEKLHKKRIRLEHIQRLSATLKKITPLFAIPLFYALTKKKPKQAALTALAGGCFHMATTKIARWWYS